MKPLTDIDDPRLVKALAHPVRVRVLRVLEARTASPSEISQELDVPLGTVSYHVRQLAELGLIELVKTTPRRGAVEHHYRANARPRITDEAWSKAPRIAKEALIGCTLGQIGDQVSAAAIGGGFTADGAHLSRMPLALDPKGWRQVSQELSRTLERLERIRQQSAERLIERSHEDERRATVVMMLFEPAEEPAPRRSRRTRSRGRRPAAKHEA